MRNPYNKHVSFAYQFEKQKMINRKIRAEQYLVFLGVLYGHLIEEGAKTIRDYADMTMFDVREELQIRTQILQNRADRKANQYFEEAKAKEIAMFEQLKRLN